MSGDDPRPEATEVVGPPRLLSGKYRIGKLIGEGGMGSVYLAEHTGLDAQVAIKLLNETCIADPDALARFRREAKAMAAVRHDNVVAVMDTGTDEDGVPFIVMEFLEGETLGSILRRNRTLAPASACRIGTQILSGLAAAHQKGIVHRDLKPGNVFMARQPDDTVRAKILDFGVSKLLDSSALSVTADGVAVGTPTYMAPEQVYGQLDLDPRVDIYAAGVIMYRMLTGKLPYVAGSSEELSEKILEGNPKPPSEIVPTISAALEAAVLKAMSREPGDRYQDADSLRAALTSAASAELGPPVNVAEVLERHGVSTLEPEEETVAASPAAIRSTIKTEPEQRPPSRRKFIIASGFFAAAGVAGVAAWRALASGEARGPALRFGVTQFLPSSELEPRFANLLAYLSKELGRDVELRIATDADELAAWISSGQVELAALSPFPFVTAERKIADLSLLATAVTPAGRAGYFGSILVKTKSNIRSLEELEGKPFCYVRRGSTSGWLLPRRELRTAGLDPDTAFPTVHFGQDHLGTLKLLDKGECAAAAVYTKLWHDADEHMLDPASFRSIADFFMPHDAYVAGPGVDKQVIKQVQSALLALEPRREQTIKTLKALDIGGFLPVESEAYAPIREAIAAEPKR